MQAFATSSNHLRFRNRNVFPWISPYRSSSSFSSRIVIRSLQVLIINTPSGGHAHIGPHLAEALSSNGHSVDVYQRKKSERDDAVPMRSSYESLSGVSLLTKAPSSSTYDAVYDNNSKSLEDLTLTLATGASGARVFYVSSAGAYTYDAAVAPHIAGDAAKGPTIDCENALFEAGLKPVCFRPIYIVGGDAKKREYLDYFFDRILRGRTVYIPGTGDEFTSITHVKDVADIMARALDRGLRGKIVNAVSNRGITFAAIANMCAEACGKDVRIQTYDVQWAQKNVPGFIAKKAFPMRPRHFFADTLEAENLLEWTPKYSGSKEAIKKMVDQVFREYVEKKLHEKQVDFAVDEALKKALA